MLFYVDEISVRLIYTLDFIFKEHGLEYQLTNDKSAFNSFSGRKIAYSRFEFGHSPVLYPSALLFEESYRETVHVEKGSWQETDCLKFDSVSDPLASIFYVITRYEEYHCKFPDDHGRFTAKESLQSKFGWLHIQIVERWIEAFFRFYSPELYDELISRKQVRIIPSFDIDNTFSYKWKEGWRSWLSNGKDMLQNNKERLRTRKLVQKGELTDPYDSFETIRSVFQSYPETRVFWQLGNYAKYDTNIAWNHPQHQKLILSLSELGFVGLHPSYASNHSDEKLDQEVLRLERITSKTVLESRQHFLKLNLPNTYRRMIERGFEKDYTMGYADDYGFRSGTAYEHVFFDLLTNQPFPNYRIVPFAYMDGTLLEYKKLTIDQSMEAVDQLIEEVKRYGGVFCFIWHNETLAEAGKWKGWRKVFDHTLEQLK
ncbi:polysaccharide deacetylase family protein [Fluviicola chungangensis]|uniref:DUF7033 domain-containing protein n=1 Tax=Fluviicola chungangensis TaxID=2597671 RepID=A0A556MMX7_9FLAO|nr:polysaccharide deacetylase family protein [Fluviicola chungangensis]TSJ41235.1 hypothetical protein FO442_15090 [Fluviicola chungangensis]